MWPSMGISVTSLFSTRPHHASPGYDEDEHSSSSPVSMVGRPVFFGHAVVAVQALIKMDEGLQPLYRPLGRVSSVVVEASVVFSSVAVSV